MGLGYGLRFKSQIGHFQVDYAINAFQQRTIYFGLCNVASWDFQAEHATELWCLPISAGLFPISTVVYHSLLFVNSEATEAPLFRSGLRVSTLQITLNIPRLYLWEKLSKYTLFFLQYMVVEIFFLFFFVTSDIILWFIIVQCLHHNRERSVHLQMNERGKQALQSSWEMKLWFRNSWSSMGENTRSFWTNTFFTHDWNQKGQNQKAKYS